MSMIDILDWKGDELIEEYVDYVRTGVAEARAIASIKTGAMVNSVRVQSKRDGFDVTVPKSVLATNRRDNGSNYYPYQYSELGYRKSEALPFLEVAWEHIGDDDSVGNRRVWRALKPSNRNGSGTSVRRYYIDKPLDDYLSRKRRQLRRG